MTILISKKKNQKNKNFIPLTSNHKDNKGKDLQYLSPQTNFLTMKIRRNKINDFNEKMEIEIEKNFLLKVNNPNYLQFHLLFFSLVHLI